MTASRRYRAWIGWGIWGLLVVVTTLATWLGLSPEQGEPIAVTDALWAYSLLGFPTVGALVVSRMPRRALGWILLVGPGGMLTGVAVTEAAVRLDTAAARAWAAWASSLLIETGLWVILFAPLLIPTGTLVSPRWRWVAGAIAAFGVVQFTMLALGPEIHVEFESHENPVGLAWLRSPAAAVRTIAPAVHFVGLALGLTSIIVRFRRSRGVERQQLKWIAGGAGFVAVSFSLIPLVDLLLSISPAFGDPLSSGAGETALTFIVIACILALPITLGIAILRYRLYDIDVIVNRALVYGALSALLATAYLALVFVLQSLVSGVERDSDLAVAASTLAVAALFRPARARVQGFIDRRFYRHKYNAGVALAGFTARLRDEVHLAAIEADVAAVVSSTLQPQHAGVWLRTGA